MATMTYVFSALVSIVDTDRKKTCEVHCGNIISTINVGVSSSERKHSKVAPPESVLGMGQGVVLKR